MMRQHDRQRQVCYASRACRATGYPTARGATVRPNKIKQMWRDKKCVTMGWLSVSHGFTAEVMARQGFDVLCVDMQHGTTDMSDVWPMLQAISQTDTVQVATCDRIREAAHKQGIKACMHCASAAFAAGAVKRGFDLVMLTSDLASMVAGARRQLDDLKAATA